MWFGVYVACSLLLAPCYVYFKGENEWKNGMMQKQWRGWCASSMDCAEIVKKITRHSSLYCWSGWDACLTKTLFSRCVCFRSIIYQLCYSWRLSTPRSILVIRGRSSCWGHTGILVFFLYSTHILRCLPHLLSRERWRVQPSSLSLVDFRVEFCVVLVKFNFLIFQIQANSKFCDRKRVTQKLW